MGRLDGKVCVITGAASGIGAETRPAVQGGGREVVGVDLDAGAEGDLAIQADVTDDDQVRDMYARAKDELGRIDVLFNNAGINPTDDASVLDTSVEAWQRVQDVNLRSVFLCCKHGIPHLLDARRRLGDQHGVLRRHDGRRRLADLLHGLEGRRPLALARARRRVRAPRRPRQRALPGPGHTPLLAGALRQGPREGGAPPRPPADGPLRRGGEIAKAALFLASDESSYVTASTFLVDGGLSGAYLTPE